MKQYKINKGRSWARQAADDQLYQVFQCFSEDQIFFYEEFEFAILERRMGELRLDQEDQGADGSQYGLKSYYSKNSDSGARSLMESKHSESSNMLKEHLAEKRKQKEEQMEREKIRQEQYQEI